MIAQNVGEPSRTRFGFWATLRTQQNTMWLPPWNRHQYLKNCMSRCICDGQKFHIDVTHCFRLLLQWYHENMVVLSHLISTPRIYVIEMNVDANGWIIVGNDCLCKVLCCWLTTFSNHVVYWLCEYRGVCFHGPQLVYVFVSFDIHFVVQLQMYQKYQQWAIIRCIH